MDPQRCPSRCAFAPRASYISVHFRLCWWGFFVGVLAAIMGVGGVVHHGACDDLPLGMPRRSLSHLAVPDHLRHRFATIDARDHEFYNRRHGAGGPVAVGGVVGEQNRHADRGQDEGEATAHSHCRSSWCLRSAASWPLRPCLVMRRTLFDRHDARAGQLRRLLAALAPAGHGPARGGGERSLGQVSARKRFRSPRISKRLRDPDLRGSAREAARPAPNAGWR